MSSPVVVSRIQNRRGTQTQFDGFVYNPAGPNSVYPHGYTGIGGYGSFPNFNAANYPNVLMPGELALCTDSRRIFLGNLNGEFLEVAEMTAGSEFLEPTPWTLPPSPTFVPITKVVGPVTLKLEFDATPFFNILYSVTDSPVSGWNEMGPNFSKNGELQITAIVPPVVPPPPPFSPVMLTDTGTDINLTPFDISFIAQLVGPKIEIHYMHNFPVSLSFSSNTISWLPF